MASAWQSKKRGKLAIHRPEGWRGTGGFWHSDLLGKVTGTLPGRPCVISDRHPGETAPSQPVFLTSSKKPLHINAVQFSFLPSRFIFPSYQKCHGNCSPGSNSPGRNRQVLPVFDPAGFCSFLRHIPKILGNLRESSRRLFWASEDNQQGEDSRFSGFPANPGMCPCPQSVTVLKVNVWLQSPGEIQTQSFGAGILSNGHNINLLWPDLQLCFSQVLI